MRLLMTTDTVGGVWTFTSELVSELLDWGHKIALISFGPSPSSEQNEWIGNQCRGFSDLTFASCDAPLEWMPQNASAYAAAEALLLDVYRSFEPDAILLSQFCFGALPGDVPKIIIAHSDVLSWASAVGRAPLADDDWLQTYCSLVQRGLDNADALVAPTQAMLNGLRTNFNLPVHAEVVANGRTLAADSRKEPRKLQAVCAGRMWDEAKNLTLINACVSPLPIMIAGELNGAGLINSSVTMLGRLSEAALLDLFRESAIYICSSVYEPFGLAPLEAALCGCAVLANDIPSLREVWGDAALYFNDASSLSRLLTELSEVTERLATAQSNSHARARTYTSARMAEKYMRLIERMVTIAPRSEAHAA